MIWEIWKERNRRIFKNSKMQWYQLVNKIEASVVELVNNQTLNLQRDINMSYWDEKMRLRWKGLKIPPFMGRGSLANELSRKNCEWVPPIKGWFKLNFDGALRGNPGWVGLGYSIHNSNGEEVAYMALPCGSSINNMAEMQALDAGINLSMLLNIKKIVIEGDSAIIINALRKGSMPDWKLNASLEKILTNMKTFDKTIFNHIYREGNRRADFLANLGADGKTLTHVVPKINP